jgi:PAS domain S-box-containing protein
MTAQAITILIIDDSAENLYVLSEQLRSQYRVLAATSGEEGLRLANSPPMPDLILLDVMMPGMDGYAVLTRLREDFATRDIPVIFLTALTDAGEVERGLELGAADYITKQNTPAVVLARVRTQLEARRARDWLKNQNALLEAEVKRRTGEILEVQSQLQATLDAIPDLLFEIGLDGRYHSYHSHHTHLLAASAAEFLGKKVSDVVSPAAAETIMSALQEAHEKGRSSGKQFELQLPHGNFWFELSVACKPGDAAQIPRFIVMSRDITERKIAERQLRDLNAHLQTVREEEKASIAREIHDDLGGTLTALKMEAYLMETKLLADKGALPLFYHIAEMSQLIDNATGVMRKIITGLRPTILDDLGLLTALEWQAAQFNKLTGVECRVNCVCDNSENNLIKLDKLRSIALFRIAQEALTNVTRHSGASRADIELYRNEEEIVMSIIDNGRGMREKSQVSSNSYGMLGMRERVNQLGGTISFDNPPGGGFNVTAILPLPGNAAEQEQS